MGPVSHFTQIWLFVVLVHCLSTSVVVVVVAAVVAVSVLIDVSVVLCGDGVCFS